MARFLYEYVVYDNLSEIYCSTFGAQWVTSLQHGSLCQALIWLVKADFWVPGACQEVEN